MKKRKIMLISAIVVVGIALIISAYFLYYYSGQCSTQECFDSKLAKCSRSFYIKDTADTIIQYTIAGQSSGKCRINVELLQVKRGTIELAPLEGKSMICSLALGVVADPQSNLANCHGLLKEEIQNMIINRMHAQIEENIGKISEQTEKIL